MLKKPNLIVVILVALVVVVLFHLPGQTVGRFKLAISGLFLPLFGLAGSSHEATAQVRGALVSRRQLVEEAEELKRQNDQLQIRLQQEQATERENARLRAAFAWAHSTRWQLKLSRVIARDPSNWWRAIQIDLGRRDGMRPNLPVLTSAGLVGKISGVGETRSQVVLLGDPSLRVAAKIPASGETGVILSSSSAPQENNMVDLGYLTGNSGVTPGQKVQTWGGGGVFPEGIPIGQIVDVRTTEYGLSKEARVQLSANLNSLDEVWVMMP
ncbi:MAG TPA: rod shape-determining protein MreC [Verrucomicrobiae bacterium]|jgi:rod shape-determining protein MreC|nr:rod shape-determining protein MreC [Verrucomicrobiae bacterium]